jgi:putative tryptophan/tyrosine transport system substrate-binding protein
MRRREFITLIGGAAAAWPLAARAQQPAMPVVGFLRNTSPDVRLVAAFRRGLNEAGYIEDQNVAIEYRWAENQDERLPALAADLVRRRVSVIVTGGQPASHAAQAATTAIPIVFATGGDPVHYGLVTSLNRPGGNITGVSFLINALVSKRLALLRELVPTATMIAFLVKPTGSDTEANIKDAQTAARLLGLQLLVLNASSERDFETAFATLVQQRAGALVINPDALFTSHPNQLVALAARHAVPTIYYRRETIEAGGLMSYGTSFADAYRQAGIYAGQILKGSKPADLPVQQPTKFELFINLKTAKALGLAVPLVLQMTANEVIE